MNYQQTVEYLFKKLPIYQRQGPSAYKKDIGNIIKISKHLGDPHLNFKSIHIAGTNGKGSTAHIISSIIQEAGYKVGLYTSPHLKDFRERIKINGKMISKKATANFINQHKNIFKKLDLSFFEMTVAMAFNYFSIQKVDIAIIETGLGGRLDSTNIIIPELSIITNISLDHTSLLGNTIQDIAKEKAGIIKENIPLVVGRKQRLTIDIFKETARNKNAKLIFANKNQNRHTELKGSYQKENVNTAVCAIRQLQVKNWKISKININNGLMNCVLNTQIKGRWEILKNNPLTICDIAHNEEGLSKVITQILEVDYQNLHFIFGTVNDKEIDNILTFLPKKATYYFCKPNIERGLDVHVLQKKCKRYKLFGNSYSSVNSALKSARENANKEDLIFIGGSTFVVAEII